MFENFDNIKNVLSISDGMIGCKEYGSDYNQVLNELFQRIRERNCKLNPNKIVTHTTEVLFFAHILSKNGVIPDPKNVKAITQMQVPKDEKQMATGKNPAKCLVL